MLLDVMINEITWQSHVAIILQINRESISQKLNIKDIIIIYLRPKS